MAWTPPGETPPSNADDTEPWYWEAELTDPQRTVLLELVHDCGLPDKARFELIEQLSLARRMEGDVCRDRFPWDVVADLAERQGIGEADVVVDLIGKALAEQFDMNAPDADPGPDAGKPDLDDDDVPHNID